MKTLAESARSTALRVSEPCPPATELLVQVARTAVQKIVVVIPAADEEQVLAACLESVAVARDKLRADYPRIGVTTLVVLDDCHDGTAAVADRYPDVRTLAVAARSVGRARRAGVTHALSTSSVALERTWIASTDADSRVPVDWLTGIYGFAREGHQAVLGTVVPDPGMPLDLEAEWSRRHHLADGHRHVHGANMSVRADVYLSAGGWPSLPSGEDVELARRLTADPEISVARTAALPVITSSRVAGRAPGGFSAYLRELAASSAGAPDHRTMPSS